MLAAELRFLNSELHMVNLQFIFTKLRKGNVFTGVCHSFCLGGEEVSMRGPMSLPGDKYGL